MANGSVLARLTISCSASSSNFKSQFGVGSIVNSNSVFRGVLSQHLRKAISIALGSEKIVIKSKTIIDECGIGLEPVNLESTGWKRLEAAGSLSHI